MCHHCHHMQQVSPFSAVSLHPQTGLSSSPFHLWHSCASKNKNARVCMKTRSFELIHAARPSHVSWNCSPQHQSGKVTARCSSESVRNRAHHRHRHKNAGKNFLTHANKLPFCCCWFWLVYSRYFNRLFKYVRSNKDSVDIRYSFHNRNTHFYPNPLGFLMYKNSSSVK